MVNADVNKNKEIQKLTGISPAQEAWKGMQKEVEGFKELSPAIAQLEHTSFGYPAIKKGTFFKILKRAIYWKMVLFCAKMESIKTSEYKRGYAEGRNYEFKSNVRNQREIQDELDRRAREQIHP